MYTDTFSPEEISEEETVPVAGNDQDLNPVPLPSDPEKTPEEPEVPENKEAAVPAAEEAPVTEPVPAAGEEKKEKKKKKGPWILLILLLLLALLACGWYFLLGPGAYKEYTVSFDTAGGEAIESVTVESGTNIDLPVPVREGYRFVRWTQNSRSMTSPYPVNSDAVLTAEWEICTFNVSFSAPDSDFPNDVWIYQHDYGTPVDFPISPSKTGYRLTGWKDSDGNDFKENTPMPAHDIELKAVYEQVFLNISFDSDGGTPVNPLRLALGDKFPHIVSSKENYEFMYWIDPHGNAVYPGSTFLWEDTTLTAVWAEKEAKTFRVTFDSRGGTDVYPVIVKEGDVLHLPADPVKMYYEFQCWEDEHNMTIHDQALLTPEDITLYAVWRRPDLSVTNNGGTEVQSKTLSGNTLTMYIYNMWNTTMLQANQPVTWSYDDAGGVITDIVTHETTFFFDTVYNASGPYYRAATITATADDGQVFKIVIYPVQGKPGD